MVQEVGPAFKSTFTAPVVSELVSAARRGVKNALSNFSAEKGSDALTFGVDVYAFVWHELELLAAAGGEGWGLEKDHQVRRLVIGEYRLACHRVGDRASDNIYECFPNNGGAVVATAKNQLQLFPFHKLATHAREVVLCLLANPATGLEGVYICIPGLANGAQITAWACAHEIFLRDEDEQNGTTAAPRGGTPIPPENTPPAQVRPKARPAQHDTA